MKERINMAEINRRAAEANKEVEDMNRGEMIQALDNLWGLYEDGMMQVADVTHRLEELLKGLGLETTGLVTEEGEFNVFRSQEDPGDYIRKMVAKAKEQES